MSAADSVTPRLYAEALPVSRAGHRTAIGGFFPGALQACGIAADFLACLFGMAMVFWLQMVLRLDGVLPVHMRQDEAVCVAVALFAVLLLNQDRVGRGSSSLLHIRETEHALRAAVQSVLVLLPFAFFLGLESAIGALLMAVMLVPASLVAGKHAYALFVRGLRWKTRAKHRAVIYSVGDAASRALSALSHARDFSLHPVLVVDDDRSPEEELISHMGYRSGRFVPAQRGPITAALLQAYRCDILIVALPSSSTDKVNAAIEAAKQAGASVALLYGTEPQIQPWTRTMDIDGLSLVPLLAPCESLCYTGTKRSLDLVGSSLLLVLLSPLFAIIALLVKLDSHGPVIFSQERVGCRGKHFRMYKFRSMSVNAPVYALSPVTHGDSRITKIGRLLRRASLDELPQLVNVFLGQMSLVGPRPEMPFITYGYTEQQRQRLQVIPGITGLWQLSSARAFPIHENLYYDFYYIRNRTFFMDIAILVHTLFFALRGGI